MKRSGRLIIGLFFCFTLLGFGLQFLSPQYNTTVRADPADAWWDSNYQYRKSFNITGQSTTETYYQVRIVVHRSAGSDSGNDVYVSTKCEADYDDIRFTNDEASPTVCSYWIEESDASSATIWVELDSITGSGTDTFYIYYGYASASAVSNAAITFYHYDDFDTDAYLKTGSSVDIDEGGDERVEWTSSASYGDAENSGTVSIPTDEWAFEVRLEFSSMAGFSAMRIFLVDISQSAWGWSAGSDGVGMQMWYSSNSFCSYAVENGVADVNATTGWSLSTTYWASVTFDGSETNAYLYTDYWETVGFERQTTGVSLTDDPDTIIFQNRDRTGCIGWADDFRIRKFVTENPQPANWGSEEEVNNVPVNDDLTVDNADDTDYFYAKYRTYEVSVDVVDEDGYADLDTIFLNFSTYWTIIYDEDDNSFTEDDSSGYIDESSSSYSKSGTYVNITFKFIIDWDHPDVTDIDFTVISTDSEPESDTDTYDTNINVETRLDVVGFILDDGNGTPDRGDWNSEDTITANGTLIYYGSVDDNPASGEVDVWISCSDLPGRSWSDLVLVAGYYEMTVDSDNAIGEDTYIVKPVPEGGGIGGTHLAHEWHSDTYIADRIHVTAVSTDDATMHDANTARVNVGANVELRFTLKYDYDETTVSTGSCTIDAEAGTYTSGYWHITRAAPAAVGISAVYSVSAVGADDTHGISDLDTPGAAEKLDIIGDQIEAFGNGRSTPDMRNDYGIGVNLYFDFRLKYDNHVAESGDSCSVNGSAAGWYGPEGMFYYQRSYGSAYWAYWLITDASEATYGITDFDSSTAPAYKVEMHWDELQAFWSVTDTLLRINLNAEADYRARLQYTSDSVEYTGALGTLNINGSAATWSGSYWNRTFSYAAVSNYTFLVSGITDTTYGITGTDNFTASALWQIWDAVDVTITRPTYWKLPLGRNATGILLTTTYAYDGANYDGTITLNDTNYAHSSAAYYGYTTSTVNGDDTYGITGLNSTNSITILWQSLECEWVVQWLEVSETNWWAQVHLLNINWTIEGTAPPDYTTFKLYKNSTYTDDKFIVSGDVLDLMAQFTTGWYSVRFHAYINYVGGAYNFSMYDFAQYDDAVPIVHTLHIEVWDIDWTDYYLYVTYETNWRNASITLWDNASIEDYFISEGVVQIPLSAIQGLHQIVLLINASSPLEEGTYDAAFTDNDLDGSGLRWEWRFLNYSVSVRWTTLWMTFKRGTGQLIPWNTFIVEVDGYICPQSWITVNTSSTVNITMYDDFGQLVYQNATYPTGSTENTHLRETLAIYILNLANQRNKPQYAVVWRGSESYVSPDIGAYSSFPYLVYGSVTGLNYTVAWYRADDGELTDLLSWTVYTSDITAYSGWDIPIVIPPGVPLEPILYAISTTLFWASFMQIIFIIGGLAVLGVLLRKRGITIPTVGTPEEEPGQDEIASPHIEEEPGDVRKAGEEARKGRSKVEKRR